MPESIPLQPTAPIDSLALDRGELPASYGKNRLVLLPVDPYLVYAYWELAAGLPPAAGSRPVLRFHESTAAESASRPFDIEVELTAGNWYVPLWTAGKFYRADLGLRAEDGDFVNLAQSKQVQTPPANAQPAPEMAIEPERELEPVVEAALEPSVERVERVQPPPPPQHDLAAVFEAPAAAEFHLLPLPVYPVELHREDPLPVDSLPAASLPVDPIPTELPFGLADLDHIDLTAYAEQRFTPGISSLGGALGH